MNTYVNLLTERYRHRHVSRRSLQIWLTGILLLAICQSFYGLKLHRSLQYHTGQRLALERQFAPVRNLRTEIHQLNRQHDELQRNERLILDLADEGSVLSLLGLVSHAARQCDQRLFLERLTYDNAPVASTRGTRTATPAMRRLSLQGVGLGNLPIAQFTAAIRDSNIFQQVELEATETQKVGMQQARTYRLRCTL